MLPRWHRGGAGLLAHLRVPYARMGSPCRRFGRILGAACSRFAEEVVCPCLCLRSCSSSDQLVVGRDWAVAKRMRTPPLEVDLQSAQLVVGQRADSPRLLALDVWLFAEVVELVGTLAQRKVQWLIALRSGTSRSR